MSINLEDIISQVKQVEDAKIQKEKGGFKGDPRLITFKKNCTYTFRLIPNIKDVNATFVTWKEVGWKRNRGIVVIDYFVDVHLLGICI